jgi:hypothetical protein
VVTVQSPALKAGEKIVTNSAIWYCLETGVKYKRTSGT